MTRLVPEYFQKAKGHTYISLYYKKIIFIWNLNLTRYTAFLFAKPATLNIWFLMVEPLELTFIIQCSVGEQFKNHYFFGLKFRTEISVVLLTEKNSKQEFSFKNQWKEDAISVQSLRMVFLQLDLKMNFWRQVNI